MSDSIDLDAIAIRMSEEYDRQVKEQLKKALEELTEAEKLLGKVKEVHLADIEAFPGADEAIKELSDEISMLELQNAPSLLEMEIEHREAEEKITQLQEDPKESKEAKGASAKGDKNWQI